jgi:hypothetical protein
VRDGLRHAADHYKKPFRVRKRFLDRERFHRDLADFGKPEWFSFLNSGKPKVEIENLARIFTAVLESVCPSPETRIANLLT